MIKPISFAASYGFTKTASQKTIQHKSICQQSPISFSGIMENLEAKRVTDANGNTYIIESGGTLVIHNGDKENKKGVQDALTGAGVGAAGTSVVNRKANQNNNPTQTTDQDDKQPHEYTKNETDNTDDIKNTSSSDDITEESDYDYDTDYDTDDDDDDDDASIFDDSLPIYKF